VTDLGLNRVLGLSAVTFVAVGFMIGGGVFVFTGLVLKIAGPALPLAYALAVIPVFISMMPLAMLGSALPTTGANYRYPSRMVSPGLAFVGVWVYLLASFFGQIPLYALSCARYLQVVWPGLPELPFALILVTFFFAVNFFGVRLAVQVQAVLVVILIAALLYYVALGLPALETANFGDPFRKGAGGLLLGTALLTFTYFGANGIIEIGGEIVNPGQTLPRAFFISFAVVAVIYVAVSLATVGAVPFDVLAGFEEPLIGVVRKTAGPAGYWFFIIGGAVLALVTTLHALFLVGTRSLLMVVHDGLFPAFLGRVHPRFHTPHILLAVIWLLSLMGIALRPPLETLASYAALGGLIIFLPVQIAALRLPRKYPERYERAGFKLTGFWFWFCPVVGVLMVVFFGMILVYDLKTPGKIGAFLLFIVSGLVYYLWRKRRLAARGVDLDRMTQADDWSG